MKKLKIGIFGAGRGVDLAKNFILQGCEIVGLCDGRKDRLEAGLEDLGIDVPTFDDFDEFIKLEMDGAIIANFFNEHAPYLLKCFEKNINVFCECITNVTMKEGVMLHDAFKKSKSIFMLAENYPQMIFNREIRRVCEGGTLGKIMYAEGEYNHPTATDDLWFLKTYSYYPQHWRNYLPATYYVTHSLGPIMSATKATPKRIVAMPVFIPFEGKIPSAKQTADRAAIMMTLNDDDSVFRFTGCAGFGAHHNSYRVCGLNGSIENLRGMNDQVMLRYNSWSIPEGAKETNLYMPKWNDKDEELIIKSGHGGADYLTVRAFLDCLREKRQPEFPFDLKSALVMSSAAILGHRSLLEKGKPYDIPDFDKEEDRKLYENDDLNPFYGPNGEKPTIPCCSDSNYKASEEQIKCFEEYLKQDLKG